MTRGDSILIRLLCWIVVAAGSVFVTVRFGWSLGDQQNIRLLLAPKLPYLGLVMAVGTFQYRAWRDMAQWADQMLHDPSWLRFEQELERARAGGKVSPEWESALTARRASVDVVKKVIGKAVLPHNEAVLTNLLFISACLLVSVCADIVLLVAGRDMMPVRAVSVGLFIVSFVPFAEIWVRYLKGLRTEFGLYREILKSQPPKT